MKVLYNRLNANVRFERPNGTTINLAPRGSEGDHLSVTEEEANLPSVARFIGLLNVHLMSLEESAQFEHQRGKSVLLVPEPEPSEEEPAEEEAPAPSAEPEEPNASEEPSEAGFLDEEEFVAPEPEPGPVPEPEPEPEPEKSKRKKKDKKGKKGR